MEKIIKDLYPMNACLLGEGYDNRLEYIKHLVDLKVIEIPSGTRLGTWTVPDEWIVREGWIKYKGEKIVDYSKDPLSVVIGSLPIHKKVDRAELLRHLHYSDSEPSAIPYVYKFYDKDWGFCIPREKVMKELTELVPMTGITDDKGEPVKTKYESLIEEGEYEVFINSEYKPGKMKIGVHTIPGKSDREILLFAHLDHPYQANDNLSAVACLLDLSKRLKTDHTVKIVFCPETIGSIAYGLTQDISKVDFVIAVDICGNNNNLLFQKSFDKEDRINRVAHCAFQIIGKSYRKGEFRTLIGSDEYFFNDPKVGIPGVMLTRHPYNEYHTSADTPDKINYASIAETGDIVQKMIEIWEKDFIPERVWSGPLMRSRYGLQTTNPQLNLNYDYLFYSIDGKRSIAELCCDFELNFEMFYDIISKLEKDGQIRRIDISPVEKPKVAGKERQGLSRKADVSRKHRKVS